MIHAPVAGECVYVHMQRKQVISLPFSLPDKPNILFVLLLTAADRHAMGYRTPRDSCTFPHHTEMNLPIPRDATSVATIIGCPPERN